MGNGTWKMKQEKWRMANDDHLLSPFATRHSPLNREHSRLTEQAVSFGQKLGEVELVVAGLAGGVEVGVAPVALGGASSA